ncbi:metal-dependent hydrolase [Bacillus sp. PS06]|uniref:metal-dependent hydrolase n=1 Tax=Bacillus sp. PS06 TaxID=2764176 RepID=UPI001785E157|nr:metal-dependent hydrolase [Bacillus sp. PS06]MBD8069930.1 metal-dependent hydrolase [Bacillus sp. PS06]
MDTVTHTFFGMTLYGAIDKSNDSKAMKKSLIVATIGGSQIPDIDVVSSLWDTEGLYQMWHRGITHSILMVPVWALILTMLCVLLFKVKDYKRLFFISSIAVFIHSTSDLFNAWGTGYFEPLSDTRVTFGVIPIVDIVYLLIMFTTIIITRFKKENSYKKFRLAWGLMALHVLIQSLQGFILYKDYEKDYDQVALSASFIPWNYTVIGKNANVIDIIDDTLFIKPKHIHTLHSKEDTNLEVLFEMNPAAKTLYQWSPFVVVVDDDERIGIYDPRFYMNGESFLFEYVEK